MARYRKKPIAAEAVQYTGDNVPEMETFAREHFGPVAPEDRGDDPEITAEIFDVLHSTWIGVKTGDWIVKGVKGEFYPCAPEVFRETYERVDSESVNDGESTYIKPTAEEERDKTRAAIARVQKQIEYLRQDARCARIGAEEHPEQGPIAQRHRDNAAYDETLVELFTRAVEGDTRA